MIIRGKLTTPLTDEFVKVVVDVEENILAYGCELHIDCADELVAGGSDRKNLWGANVYRDPWRIECISLINIRPQDGNRSMEIQLPEIRTEVEGNIARLLAPDEQHGTFQHS